MPMRKKHMFCASDGGAMVFLHCEDANGGVSAPEPQAEYGCLFCVTGREEMVAERIRLNCTGIHAVTMRKMKYRTSRGIKSSEESLLLPGYVFFRADANANPICDLPKIDVIRILTTGVGEWRLCGGDRRFAEWLFQYDGLLDFSKAYCEGERIRIIAGPLKDMEGKIVRIDKRGRSGQIIVDFHDRPIAIWLGFELVDTIR